MMGFGCLKYLGEGRGMVPVLDGGIEMDIDDFVHTKKKSLCTPNFELDHGT